MLTSRACRSAFSALLCLVSYYSFSQSTCPPATPASCPGYPTMEQYKVEGLDIAGMFSGMLVYAPPGYECTNPAKKYPVIVFFHGLGARNEINNNNLCAILTDQSSSLPGLIEQGFVPKASGTAYTDSFVVISPQYRYYDYPNNFATAQHVDPLLDYIVNNFQVDPARIYLTGISSGGNIVVEYAGSSPERANRVAAINVASGCSRPGIRPNDTVAAAANIGNAELAAWFIACETDCSCNFSGCANRADQIAQMWYDSISAIIPNTSPAFPLLKILTAGGTDPLNNCQGFAHNTWTAMYDPNFEMNGTNLYEWFAQFTASAVVPVRLKEFTARLVNGKVVLRWVTTDENNSASFTLEKASADQRFSPIATLPAGNLSQQERSYEYVDERPFEQVSYYRLLQTDRDGKKRYYETRRILNRSAKTKISTLPNPFRNEVSVFVTTDRRQRVIVYLTSPNGSIIRKVAADYDEGTSEIKFNTSDLTSGIYFLRIEAEDFTESRKIIRR